MAIIKCNCQEHYDQYINTKNSSAIIFKGAAVALAIAIIALALFALIILTPGGALILGGVSIGSVCTHIAIGAGGITLLLAGVSLITAIAAQLLKPEEADKPQTRLTRCPNKFIARQSP